MSTKRPAPSSFRRAPAIDPHVMADVVLMFLPLMISVISLLAQVVLHFYFWDTPSHRAIAGPLFGYSVLFL